MLLGVCIPDGSIIDSRVDFIHNSVDTVIHSDITTEEYIKIYQ